MNSKIAIVHKNCPDGCASAVLAKKIFPEIKLYHLAHNNLNEIYEKIIDKAPQKSLIMLIDICCDEVFLKTSLPKVMEKQISLKIYEHHETNNWLIEFNANAEGNDRSYEKAEVEINFDIGKSASYIFFEKMVSEHLFLEEYRDFILAINDRDLWINEIEQGTMLAKLHQCLGDSAFVERFLHDPRLEFNEKENFVLELEQKKESKRNELLLKRMEIKEDEAGLRYGVILGEANGSDLLNLAIVKFSLDYAILINLHSKKGSIRSSGRFDCAKYAEERGGGGHKNAAGFKVKFNLPEF